MHWSVISLAIATKTQVALAAPCDDQSYDIEARLDETRHVVYGTENIHWCNTSDALVDRLYFHLYLNAFRNAQSVFMREGGDRLRNQKLRTHGRTEILSLVTQGNLDLLPHSSTDVGPAEDCTQMVVRLRQPVAPGGHLDLVVRFRSYLPQIVSRSGYWRQFHMVAQWYPKLARLEPDGRWASFPYHGLGEFYSDFARYKTTITVPKDYVLGSTGERISSHTRGLYKIETYFADRVHDVVWCAYPFFRKVTFSGENPRIEILAPIGYNASVRRHVSLIRLGIDHYGRLFGRYPYSTLTVIIPPRGAQAASSMEYPTLFVSAGPWFSSSNLYFSHPTIDEVATHELAHQWFHGIIANNEVEQPLLDEGISQWASYDLLRQLRQRANATRFSLLRFFPDYFELARIRYLRPNKPHISSTLPAYAYKTQNLVHAVYLRPALVLETVGRVWGKAKLERTLGRYARDYRFGHPKLVDLYERFDAVYGTGFSENVLKPALSNEKPVYSTKAGSAIRNMERANLLEAQSTRTGKVTDSPVLFRPFLSILLFVIQIFLGIIGV